MTPPIRPEVFAATEFTDPEKFTLREAVEWYKRLVRSDFGVPTAFEVQFMNERWSVLCEAISGREGISAGWISYVLSEIAQQEYRLLRTAQEEADAALSYEAR